MWLDPGDVEDDVGVRDGIDMLGSMLKDNISVFSPSMIPVAFIISLY